ncbi:energy-coupling factor transporter ATPase [Ruminococcaceae bacterium OttesenSCG-928-L11]|nr:energy-coupling factor transporter ATPase [Ruminococcaceae bacterium OttesenSCG-928-L11]
MEAIITCQDISFSYARPELREPPVPVFHNLDFTVERGGFVAILGHNGSGKSTLAKHFNAILLPEGGTVYVNGIDTREEDRLLDIRSHVGMVFQNPDNQIVATVVEEDVAFALENMGVPPEEIRKRVEEALDAVNMMEYRSHAPHQLSGGQKQRVAIAGVIAMRPDCIVLDEPTAMLDPRGRQEVMRTLKGLGKYYGITVVLITHFMDEAAKADRVVVMDDGKIILDDAPGEVFSHVERLKSVGLDVPQATELAHELRLAGFDIPGNIITEAQCVEALQGLLDQSNAGKDRE